jgi:hypothetical protein
MDHAKDSDSPAAVALGKALDSYAEWLNSQVASRSNEADKRSGASLLHAVAEIRRHHCPGASQLMTDLLLVHTTLSTLLFEQQLKFVRGQPTQPLLSSKECVSLIQRQIATIAAMRTTCVSQRGLCIHTTPSVKNAAHQTPRSGIGP